MRKFLFIMMALMLVGFSVTSAGASPTLWEYAVMDKTATYYMDTSAPGFTFSGFNTNTGLGTITYSTTAKGTQNVGAWFNHEFDQVTQSALYDKGSAVGSPKSGQTWEINDPDPALSPGIYTRFQGAALSNGTSPYGPWDASMAMIWSFELKSTDIGADLSFTVSETEPKGGFYLTQFNAADPSTGELPIYFYSELRIASTPVPLPAAVWLLGSGLLGLAGWRRRNKS